MGIDKKLLEILCCPVTKVPVKLLPKAKLKLVNEQIAKDAASVWLYLYPQLVVASSDVCGYPVNGLNSQFPAYTIVRN